MKPRCFACNKPVRPGTKNNAVTNDGQHVVVGPDCLGRIKSAIAGYQPPLGGPRLFSIPTC